MSNYKAEVLVRGRPVRVYKHKGKSYIEGRKGSNFELRITNNTDERIEVVTSVDGLSVIDGEECGANSKGYIIDGNDTLIIPGWKLENNKAAKFKFEEKKNSYSNQIGKGTANVGVIGVMVFEEEDRTTFQLEKIIHEHHYDMGRYPYRYPHWNWGWDDWTWTINHSGCFGETSIRKSSMDTLIGSTPKFTSSSSSGTTSANVNTILRNSADTETLTCGSNESNFDEEKFAIGTGWGKEVQHNVTSVEFIRESTSPAKILTLFYDTRKALEERGIEIKKAKEKQLKDLPNAFPISSSCKPPKHWKKRMR